jgi:hypothetical protein
LRSFMNCFMTSSASCERRSVDDTMQVSAARWAAAGARSRAAP